MDFHTKPARRHKVFQEFKREHRLLLLISLRIRKGLREGVDIKRVKEYADWAFKTYVKPQFEGEEKVLFPLVPEDDKDRKRSVSEHRRLERLFNDSKDPRRALSLIEEELDVHVRTEARKLFKHIEEMASEEQLLEIYRRHREIRERKEWKDKFWE